MEEKKVITVSQLTATIKGMLEGGIGMVSVKGEISNCKPAASGHVYFVLKDADATLSAALFRGQMSRLKNVQLKDGAEVICHGKLSVYPPRGSYQIIVDSIEAVGAGSLQAAFEALKKKLLGEGLFDLSHKKALPSMPQKIVVITSPTGAAIRDVLSVLKRRFSGIQVIIIPTLVQGEAAAADLIRALRIANEYKLGEVILLTRGGGSLEDLWCFNSEELAREIFKSEIPVVSAVGHEVDFTIADFVADLRAPTPSAAAEILVKEKKSIDELVQELKMRLVQVTQKDLRQANNQLNAIIARLRNPKDRINELRLRFDDWSERLVSAMDRSIERRGQLLHQLQQSMQALSPLRVLERGYAIAQSNEGAIFRSAKNLKKGEEVYIRFHDGRVKTEVN